MIAPGVEGRPWWRPGMTARDIALWEAAERTADTAPEIRPGDPVALDLQRLFSDFPGSVRAARSRDTAA